MAIEIVDLPIENGWIFTSYVKLPEGITKWYFSSLLRELTSWSPPLLWFHHQHVEDRPPTPRSPAARWRARGAGDGAAAPASRRAASPGGRAVAEP